MSGKKRDDVDLGALQNTVGFLLRRAYRRSRDKVLPVMERYGLKEIEFSTLLIIGGNPGISLTAIAEAVAVDLPVAHRFVRNLESLELIERSKSPRDHRVSIFRILPAGERLARDAGEACFDADKDIYAQLSPEQYAELIGSLQILAGLFEEG